jgi:hypothetical protein
MFWKFLRSILGDMHDGMQINVDPTFYETRKIWERAETSASLDVTGMEDMVQFAWVKLESGDYDEEFSESVETGVDAWEKLKTALGGDVQGTFRRRDLIPVVLVPRQVSNRYGDSDKAALFENLRQAHVEFIFGAEHAALAMMRSILELVLTNHYGTDPKNRSLNQQIEDVKDLYPEGVTPERLKVLKEYADTALHLKNDKRARYLPNDGIRRELEIISLFVVLRALIEGAPSRTAR